MTPAKGERESCVRAMLAFLAASDPRMKLVWLDRWRELEERVMVAERQRRRAA